MIPWLEPNDAPQFPDTQTALSKPNGLLAAGGQLGVEWLLAAYRRGIFPWFSADEPILWWSPAPRAVLTPEHFRESRSLRKLARQNRYQIEVDTNFDAVIQACAEPRNNQPGTWINDQMIKAYINLHRAGLAHSIECRMDGELVGGLYGVALGQVFFGESMFSRQANTSKLCLRYLVQSGDYHMIDCQLPTAHLYSLGATEISRRAFENALNRWI